MSTVAALVRSAVAAVDRRSRRQWAIFGWMGVPMVLIFLLSAAWTSMLAAIQLAPTEVANYLMGTGDFDFGEFWLLARADDSVAVPAAALLIAFAAGYVWLALRMVFVDELRSASQASWSASLRQINRVAVHPVSTSAGQRLSKSGEATPLGVMPADPPTTRVTSQSRWRQSLSALTHRFVAPTLQQDDNSAHALPKLVLQSTTLIKYLRDGFPIFLILNYAVLLMLNWLIACDRSLHKRPDPRFVLRRIFFSFDLFFAVLAPMIALVYAYNHFAFDRDEFETRLATLSPGAYDRTARLFADPTQVSLFRIAFQAMQLTSPTSVLIKTVLNVFTLRKWHETITTLVALDRCPPLSTQSGRRSSATQSGSVAGRGRYARMSRLLFAVCFASLGTGLFVYTVVSVVSSKHVCRVSPSCQVPSYRWYVGARWCSCVVFVDRELRIRSYAEWIDLVDTTANLASVATTGDLRFVQIINRQLPVLPDELQRCRDLEQLILIHTRTLALPDWAAEFTNLQYLNIEGDLTSKQLTHLPQNLFADMPHLLFLHLGTHFQLPALPRFGNQLRLRYLVLALLHGISEIPSLDHLVNLRQLNVIDAVRVTSLPSVKSLTKLGSFVLVGRNPVCCNGFLTGVCNLTKPSCLDRTAAGEPPVTCVQERISSDEYTRLTSIQGTICAGPPPEIDLKGSAPSTETVDGTCGGVMYRHCTQNGAEGICFAQRMNPIACQVNPAFTAMRRLQIERKVGDKCDPVVEAWLGCSRG